MLVSFLLLRLGAGDHFRDLLGNGRLPCPVIINGQLIEHILGRIGSRLHGGHTGVMLGAIGLHQRAIHKPGHIVGHNVLKHFVR